MTIVKEKEEKYLKLRLYFSVLNTFIYIVIGFTIIAYNTDNFYILISTFVIHLIVFILNMISVNKGYVVA